MRKTTSFLEHFFEDFVVAAIVISLIFLFVMFIVQRFILT
jgi:hypothetical protein